MPKIPTYSFESRQLPSENVRVDPNMFNAEYQANQRLGSAISDTAAQAAQIQFNLQAAKNYKDSAQADIAMSKAWDEYQATLNPSSDETKWQSDWQKKLDSTVTAAIPADASDITRKTIALNKERFAAKSGGDVAMQAKANSVEKAKVTGLTRVNQQWINGDAEGAQKSLTDMANMGLIYHEDIPKLMEKGLGAMQKQNANRLIANDPIAATDALSEKTESGRWKNFTKLDEDDRLTLLNMAHRRTTEVQSENYQGLIDGLNNEQLAKPEELQNMVDQKLITPRQMKSYTAAYRHGKVNTDPGEIGQLLSDIGNYDPTKDPGNIDQAKLLGRIATSGYPQNVQSQANELLKKKVEPSNTLNSPTAKSAMGIIGENFRLGVYGKFNNRVQDPKTGNWSTETNQTILKQAQAARAEDESALNTWLEANPKATPAEAQEFLNKTSRQRRANSMWTPTINPMTGKAQ